MPPSTILCEAPSGKLLPFVSSLFLKLNSVAEFSVGENQISNVTGFPGSWGNWKYLSLITSSLAEFCMDSGDVYKCLKVSVHNAFSSKSSETRPSQRVSEKLITYSNGGLRNLTESSHLP